MSAVLRECETIRKTKETAYRKGDKFTPKADEVQLAQLAVLLRIEKLLKGQNKNPLKG